MSKAIKLLSLLLVVSWLTEGSVWSREIKVETTATPEPFLTPAVSAPSIILEKLNEGDELLISIPLKVGTKNIPYVEKRISRNGQTISIVDKKLAEPEKEIALKLLDLETEQIEIIKITKRGAELVSPPGYKIELVERPSGIRWNKWNTSYRVVEPHNLIVLKNKYPEIEQISIKERVKNKAGKWVTVNRTKGVIKEIVYSPYSEDLHTVELVENGAQYIKGKVAEAMSILAVRGVRSRAFPDKLVAETGAFKPEVFTRLPLMEQSDFGEFLLDPKTTHERVEVILALNPETAYTYTCSKADACGWVQFTPTTYKNIRKEYPVAQLDPDFKRGAGDHLNSMMAAILLYDYNLNGFIVRHGEKILQYQHLDELMAAAYNGRPTTASSSLKAAISKNLPDWTGKLKLETKGFIAKYRYLDANNLP